MLAALLVPAWSRAPTAAYFSGAGNIIGSGFNGPAGVTVDRSGNIFVPDYSNNVVKEITARPTTGTGPHLARLRNFGESPAKNICEKPGLSSEF
ncbi:MAG: hypothetical protein ACP5E5_09580 [Acidobacteriaceae bacterium]